MPAARAGAPYTTGSRGPGRHLSVRGAVLGAVMVALAARLLMLGSVPLMLTNDSVEYLSWGARMALGEWPELSTFRTPGYPLLLGACLAVFGEGSTGVLLVQHVLGLGAVALAALAGCRLAGARWGLATGVLVGLDPWMLALESFALTEAPMAALVVVAMALVASGWSSGLRGGLALGAVLACAVLVRPAGQVLLPFLALAATLGALRTEQGWPRALRTAIGVTVGIAALLGPWIAYNRERGVPGIARGFEVSAWLSFQQAGLLDDAWPLSGTARDAYDAFRASPQREGDRWVFIRDAGMLASDEASREIGAWCAASARARPLEYLESAAYALAWQMNWLPPGRQHYNEVHWLLSGIGTLPAGSAGEHPPNLMTQAEPRTLRPYGEWPTGGLAARFYAWLTPNPMPGFPQIPLLLCTAGASLLALRRLRLDLACLYAAPLAYLGAHIVMLAVYNRFSVPVWMAGYLAIPGLAALWMPRTSCALPVPATRSSLTEASGAATAPLVHSDAAPGSGVVVVVRRDPGMPAAEAEGASAGGLRSS